MSKIKGDINKAIGVSSFEVKGVEFDISNTTLEDIVQFKRLPIKYANKDTVDAALAFQDDQVDWIFNYIKRVCEYDGDDNKLRTFVFVNLELFIKEITIGMGIRTREEYEKALEDYIKSKN